MISRYPHPLSLCCPLRHSSDRVNQLEALVETYKRKLEDLGDLRRQVRLLEERNTVYMQRTCELEEELRRANAVRGQLDTYKRQARRVAASSVRHLSDDKLSLAAACVWRDLLFSWSTSRRLCAFRFLKKKFCVYLFIYLFPGS